MANGTQQIENLDWALRLSDSGSAEFDKVDPLRWRKEVIYAGDHFDGKRKFTVTEEDIDHWVKSGNERLAAGIKTPLPIGHTSDPEANRGWVDRFEKVVDEKEGRISFYNGGTVRDEDAKTTLKSNDVSMYVPVEHKTVGRVWKRPMAHLAITSTPRVKGLKGFELALSEPSMRLAEMEKKMEDMEDMEDEPQKKGKMKDGKDQITAGDHIRRLHKGGTSYRSILEAIVRADPEGLVESLEALEPPRNRFHNEDHDAIDSAAHALAETNQEQGNPPKAWLVREDDATLVLAEFHPEAFQVVEAG